MGKTKQWANAKTIEAQRALRMEMYERYNALVPCDGQVNKPRGAVKMLAAKYGLTTAEFVNKVVGVDRMLRRRVS